MLRLWAPGTWPGFLLEGSASGGSEEACCGAGASAGACGTCSLSIGD